jgi:hypothetical protein
MKTMLPKAGLKCKKKKKKKKEEKKRLVKRHSYIQISKAAYDHLIQASIFSTSIIKFIFIGMSS